MNFFRRVVCGFVALGLCLAMTAPALAATWDGGGGDGLWNTAANWSPDGVPSSGNTYIDGAFSVTVATDVLVNGAYTNIRNGADLTINANLTSGDDFRVDYGSTVTMNAGTLTGDEKMKFGDVGGVGTFYMKGGTVTMTDDLEIYGGSLLEYSGGSFTCPVELELSGTVKVVGYDATGLLSIDGMKSLSGGTFEFVPNASGLITSITNLGGSVSSGLVVNLDALTAASTMTLFDASAAQSAFSSIGITKDGTPLTLGTEGALNVGEYYLDYLGGTGNDVVLDVNVVPEPSSIVLLTTALLGALGFVRRRRTA